MKRRAKLNLTPEREIRKQAPAGFDDNPSGGKARMQDSQRTRQPHVGGTAATAPQTGLDQTGAWMDGRKLLKVALILAAAGLSIYFLKRRFYP